MGTLDKRVSLGRTAGMACSFIKPQAAWQGWDGLQLHQIASSLAGLGWPAAGPSNRGQLAKG